MKTFNQINNLLQESAETGAVEALFSLYEKTVEDAHRKLEGQLSRLFVGKTIRATFEQHSMSEEMQVKTVRVVGYQGDFLMHFWGVVRGPRFADQVRSLYRGEQIEVVG